MLFVFLFCFILAFLCLLFPQMGMSPKKHTDVSLVHSVISWYNDLQCN
jgi:hypothetical protein